MSTTSRRFRQRRSIARAAAAGLLGPLAACAPGLAIAQAAWPAKPVRLIVPFVPGGTTDIVARLLAQGLSEAWGQSVIVENRAGAGGNIGADLVAKSPPDGYTLLVTSGSIFTVNPYLYKSLPFDAQKDFTPITMVASGPMLISVHPSVPARNIRELIALAKAKPASLSFGSAGVGSQVQMAAENFAFAAGIELQHVPYRGEAAALNDLAGGQIQMMAGNLPAAIVFASQGKIRPLAVTGKSRAAQLPSVPTVAESGLPGFVNVGWFGLMGPAGLPADIVERVRGSTAKLLGATDVRARLFVNGMDPVGNTPTEFVKAIADEAQVWQKVIRERGLTAQ